ncbi:helix-turn-helix domain-containing protein [Kribbella antibiotica]|uniref:Helix-turn-helix domain-containing protein n=1 Tax=Kribbella antibiotica TaxID=190195 RepID=A0A4R4YZC0_9ACTN|nr:helix-turn-helix transcriptional regulator [Kribbella antibiotica]TDD49082.1 helix-turn-helix domain-containing protein [Kribbella antibiotica]
MDVGVETRSFGELLRRFRGAAQLTQTRLAERSGVGADTIRSLESGRRKSPREVTLQSLADALGLSRAERVTFAAAGADRTSVPHELPADVQDFTGRADEVRRLVYLLAVPGMIAITGPAGAGKTALAVHAARKVAFPAGEVFRRGALGPVVPAAGSLLVLDDVATTKQVPKATKVTIVVTSRQPVCEVATDRQIVLGALPVEDSVRLLHQLAGADRWQSDPAATQEIVELCGGLPTALRRAAARMVGRPSWSPADLRGWLQINRTAGTA